MSREPRRIVIVGGVAGGASAATRARRCNEDARIVMFEKGAHVSFANCGMPYYDGGEIADRESLLVAKPELLRRRFNIDVRSGHEVTSIDRQRKCVTVVDLKRNETFEEPYDRLILAPGSKPIRPPLPGVDSDRVLNLHTLDDADRLKALLDGNDVRKAVVVGAGFIGLEIAEQLKRRGLEVVVAELQPQVLPPLDREMASSVQQELARQDVEVRVGDGLAKIEVRGGDVAGVRLNSGQVVAADLVLLAMGVRPNVDLARAAGLELGAHGGIRVNEFMQSSDPSIYAVGDAVEYAHGILGHPVPVPLAGPANRAGRVAGEHAATDRAQPMSPVVGTAVVRVFDKTVAMTGLSARRAQEAGLANSSAIIEARHHAGYYPGGEPMLLKLVFDPESGRVLGAQAVGGAGVDKRIDIVATALHFGATVRDLAGLDLAYAPQFGSAKDPVHLVAFVACNQLDGYINIEPPDSDLEQCQVVDVRTAEEWADGHLANAVPIPLDELRERLGELDPQRETVTVCRSGKRAYVAARILSQHGFRSVSDLTGGMLVRALIDERARNNR